MKRKKIDEFYSEFKRIDKYLTYEDIMNIKNKYGNLYSSINNNLLKKILNLFFIYNYRKINILKNYQNRIYIDKMKKDTKILLDNINGYSLDDMQRNIVLSDEDSILVVAGAGCGKTLTLVGKINYLIKYKNVREDEILCISFTNASTTDIKNALLKSNISSVSVLTFHKLALALLSDFDYKISWEGLLEYCVDEYFKSNFQNCIILESENIAVYELLKKQIVAVINLLKANNLNVKNFKYIFNDYNISHNDMILLSIIKEIYNVYDEELKSQNMIDFNDMINYAASVKKINLNFKYIVIDEYQDTSFARYNLIRKIRNYTSAKILAVGDDFQSIYRFTGCDINMFLNFEEYFGQTKRMFITKTYRNSENLISVSGKFIMKNKMQIKKKLISSKSCDKPIVIVYCESFLKKLEDLINIIDTDIFILGRNTFDINFINESKILKKDNDDIIDVRNKNKRIKFLTVHRSKGLECDNVIILNMIDNYLGFPNQIVDSKIIGYITNNLNTIPYDEERRLFYVALTRTKNKVYLLTKRGKESIFVKEILKYSRKNIQIIS